jgi:hypothetical protein
MCVRPRSAAISLGIAALLPWLTQDIHEASAAQPRQLQASPQQANHRAQRQASVHWQHVPLHNAITRLKTVFGETVFVDRRVDPGRRVTLDVDAAAVDDVMRTLADVLSLGVSRLGELRYLGPLQSAEQLRTIAAVRGEEIARLPAIERTALERKQRMSWRRLAEPRTLAVSLAQQRGWRIVRAERIPHDLWAAGELPALSATEQLTVLLTGFDLTFKINALERALEIVPLEPVTIRREYPLPSRSPDTTLLRQELQSTASHRMEATRLIVDARVEQHERLAELFAGRTVPRRLRRPAEESAQRYTLRVQEQSLRAVLQQLADRLEWTIEFDEAAIRAAGRSIDTRVSFSVENGSEDELLNAVLSPAGLHYRRDGERLIIVPRAGAQ